MTTYSRQPPGSNNWPEHHHHHHHHHDDDDECGPISDPADQPKPPGDKCEPWPKSHPPRLPEPEPCPEPPCCCPYPTHPPGPNCLEDLVSHQDHDATEAAEAAKATDSLKAILDKANAALKEYTLKRQMELIKDWKAIDADMAEVVRRLVCTIPCWWCLIECHICPLLYAIRYREQKLRGTWKAYDEVHSLYDLQYWLANDVRRKELAVKRIEAVLGAWESPAKTIADAIAANRELIKKAPNPNTAEYTKFLYDVFFQLVPLHLAIAPPASSGVVTVIPKKYTQFCECDVGEPDDCCGPNVGVLRVRDQLVKPQPYLVAPTEVLSIICCIAKERYLPASAALARAKARKKRVDDEVSLYEQDIERRIASLPDDARAALPWPVDCEKYEMPDRERRPGYETQTAR